MPTNIIPIILLLRLIVYINYINYINYIFRIVSVGKDIGQKECIIFIKNEMSLIQLLLI